MLHGKETIGHAQFSHDNTTNVCFDSLFGILVNCLQNLSSSANFPKRHVFRANILDESAEYSIFTVNEKNFSERSIAL